MQGKQSLTQGSSAMVSLCENTVQLLMEKTAKPERAVTSDKICLNKQLHVQK